MVVVDRIKPDFDEILTWCETAPDRPIVKLNCLSFKGAVEEMCYSAKGIHSLKEIAWRVEVETL